MAKFSKTFGIAKSQAELDFVDIDIGKDTPLYVDPYALTTRNDIWSNECHRRVVTFFNAVLDSITSKQKKKGIQLLSNLGEPEETHLGVSKKGNRGKGVGSQQAEKLYNAFQRSKASQTGLLEDLSDFALFIPGIGRDKISDITTNVIRRSLIDYTQAQCRVHNIPLSTVGSGFYWNPTNNSWEQEYVELPIHLGEKILLVPKYTVRYQVGVDATSYRRYFVLEFLQEEHLRADDSLVTTLRDNRGRITGKKVYKKTVDKHYPKGKDFLADFSLAHPEIVDKYRDSLKSSALNIPDISGGNLVEVQLAERLKKELTAIPTGSANASKYHNCCLSIMSFLFFPNLIYPKKEREINRGRKRIDMTYTNGKVNGLFYRISLDQNIKANTVHVECKNYTEDVANPELDQLLGRFDNNRGRFGMLLFRHCPQMDTIIQRCRDAAKQGLGIALPIDDDFIVRCLALVEANQRMQIDRELEQLYQKVIC